ncbi:hypothetical protein ACFW9F_16545, partial [Streptomyces sp. NPDC059506]|uniref:hypothetical protein n=1 Tax=Streptomyces sp. NPDC059506 TaxID=3347751 RepID=UPI0036C68DE4
ARHTGARRWGGGGGGWGWRACRPPPPTTEYVKDLLHRLEPYGHEPRVIELRERARPLLAAPA